MTKATDSPRRRKSRPSLSRALIAERAFDMIDDEGIGAFSARRLAQALGCEAMSIYHHVPNMEAVLDDVVDRLLGRLELPAQAARLPRRDLLRMARAFIELADRHPRVFLVAVSRRWATPNAYALARTSMAMFQASGASASAALSSARILGAYLGGAGSALAGWHLARTEPDEGVQKTLERTAPGLRQRSNVSSVRRDLYRGVEVVVDALLTKQ